MGDDHLFNPFVRGTDPGVTLDDTRELADVEAEEELAEQAEQVRVQASSAEDPAKSSG
jgi:hypothetical protein